MSRPCSYSITIIAIILVNQLNDAAHFFALFCAGLEKGVKVRIFLHSFVKLNFFAVKRRVFLQKNRRVSLS